MSDEAAVQVLVIDDSTSSMETHGIAEAYTMRGLPVRIVSHAEQAGLVESYCGRDAGAFVGSAGDAPPRGAGIVGNIGKLAVLDSIRRGTLPSNVLVWHVDSDHQLAALTMDEDGRVRLELDAFDYFRVWLEAFSDPTVKLVAAPVTGDPTVSPFTMVNTVLSDLLGFFSMAAQMSPTDPGLHLTRAPGDYAIEKMPFYDFDAVLRRHAPRPCVSYLPFVRGPTVRHQMQRYVAELTTSLYGCHPTRPIVVPREGVASSVWAKPRPSQLVFTGNYVYRPVMLRYPLPFVTWRPRMIGPIFGAALRYVEGPSIRFLNLPVFHRRVPRDRAAAEWRYGVEANGGGIDLFVEASKQVLGDILLRFVEDMGRLGLLTSLPRVGREEVCRKLLTQAADEVRAMYLEHFRATDALLGDLHGLCLGSTHWWRTNRHSKGLLRKLEGFFRVVMRNFSSSSKVADFVKSLPEGIDREGLVREVMNLRQSWSLWGRAVSRDSE